MSAGDQDDHYVQDTAEAYLAWKLQAEIERRGLGLDTRASELEATFREYLEARDVEDKFDRSLYKSNVDATFERIADDLHRSFADLRFGIRDVEKEFRDQKLKGDLVVELDGEREVPVSVKNYKRGFRRIQLCSGTWNSFLNNFIFKSAGVGTLIDPFEDTTFRGNDRPRRTELVEKLGFAPLLRVYEYFDTVNDEVREFYGNDPSARHWSDVSLRWKSDCGKFGSRAARVAKEALDKLSTEKVKDRLLAMTGLDDAEELLLLGKSEYLFSLTHPRYRDLVHSVQDPDCSVGFRASGQTLRFAFDLDGREVATVDVPFTLQKNGAWNLPTERYEGSRYHPKEKMELAYGERRPKKSRELATSTNTYLDLRSVI